MFSQTLRWVKNHCTGCAFELSTTPKRDVIKLKAYQGTRYLYNIYNNRGYRAVQMRHLDRGFIAFQFYNRPYANRRYTFWIAMFPNQLGNLKCVRITTWKVCKITHIFHCYVFSELSPYTERSKFNNRKRILGTFKKWYLRKIRGRFVIYLDSDVAGADWRTKLFWYVFWERNDRRQPTFCKAYHVRNRTYITNHPRMQNAILMLI